ncbi:hypothetical protein CC80DRAFT_322483 [Byssothecium circinans]|uniref:Uncharacterized protein n=1 Tax=Byssothecium circinans TaxID=147558 RepID=A0A6A5U4B9_9PLEO|nr:hypothetical protein CC80DRAFT_322483 [Byssothecium circinans]
MSSTSVYSFSSILSSVSGDASHGHRELCGELQIGVQMHSYTRCVKGCRSPHGMINMGTVWSMSISLISFSLEWIVLVKSPEAEFERI